MPHLPLEELPALFPHVVCWIAGLERQIIAQGQPLLPVDLANAKAIGIRHPDEVRVLLVSEIPRPAHARIRELAEDVNLLSDDTAGLTAGYGILLRKGGVADRRLIAHELVHVAQYETLGIEGFLREYIRQIARDGYKGAEFETAAHGVVRRICSS
jgi:hypothetical protein